MEIPKDIYVHVISEFLGSGEKLKRTIGDELFKLINTCIFVMESTVNTKLRKCKHEVVGLFKAVQHLSQYVQCPKLTFKITEFRRRFGDPG